MTALETHARRFLAARDYPVALLMWIITLVAVLPSLCLAVYAVDRWSFNEEQRERERVVSLARNLSQALDRQLETLTDMAEVLAGSRSLVAGDIRTFDDLARDAAANGKGSFILIDRAMQQLVNTHRPVGLPLPSTGNPESVQRVLLTGQPDISDLRVAASIGRPVVAINVPVKIDGEVRYVLSCVPRNETLLEIVTQTYRPEGWLAALLDGTGKILARSERHTDFFGQQATAFDSFKGEMGSTETVDLQGRPSVAAWHASAASAWKAIVWVPKQTLTEPRLALHRLIVALLVLTFVVSAVGAWIVSHMIRSPAARVVDTARALGRGQPITYEPTIMREANIVAKEMAHAARQIAERTADLEESEERLRRASEAAGFGVFDYRPQTDRVRWSASLARLFGRKDEELELEGSEIIELLLEQDRPHLNARWSEIIRTIGPFEIEFRIRRPDGAIRWLMERGESSGPIDPVTGVVQRVTGTIIDITDRKNREEQIQLLMREVNHRSKNTLGLVQAIARQTGGETRDEFKQRFFDRLRSLATAQDLLINEGYTGLDIHDLIKSQLAHFAEALDGRVIVEGPALRLNATAAQCLGMALHELATNAAKYGALSNDRGTVRVMWQANAPTFDIRWIERGGPTVTPPASRGFGTTVIGYMIKASLKATVNVDYRAEGIEWSVTGPLAAVVNAAPAPPDPGPANDSA